MFLWLFTAWRNYRTQKAREKAVCLFEYFDGQAWKRIDPMRAWREICNDKEFDLDTMLDAAERNEEPEAGKLIACVCRVFGLKLYSPQTGKGLTDAELYNVVDDFWAYLDRLKKKAEPGPTLPTSTGPASSNGQGARAEPTKPSLDSGSASIEKKPDEVSSSCAP